MPDSLTFESLKPDIHRLRIKDFLQRDFLTHNSANSVHKVFNAHMWGANRSSSMQLAETSVLTIHYILVGRAMIL